VTRGDEHRLITKHVDACMYLVDAMPIPLSPSWQCMRAALERVQFELRMVADERRRAELP
jgi:hypothetical protein